MRKIHIAQTWTHSEISKKHITIHIDFLSSTEKDLHHSLRFYNCGYFDLNCGWLGGCQVRRTTTTVQVTCGWYGGCQVIEIRYKHERQFIIYSFAFLVGNEVLSRLRKMVNLTFKGSQKNKLPLVRVYKN